MALQKESKLMGWIQTLLLGVIATVISFCANFLWKINSFMASTQIVDAQQSETIKTITQSLDRNRDDSREQLGRIIRLEAILPDKIKIKSIGK